MHFFCISPRLGLAGSDVTLDFENDIVVSAESTQAFYIVLAAGQTLRTGSLSDNPIASDDNIQILNPARYVTGLFGPGYNEQLTGGGYEPISW